MNLKIMAVDAVDCKIITMILLILQYILQIQIYDKLVKLMQLMME